MASPQWTLQQILLGGFYSRRRRSPRYLRFLGARLHKEMATVSFSLCGNALLNNEQIKLGSGGERERARMEHNSTITPLSKKKNLSKKTARSPTGHGRGELWSGNYRPAPLMYYLSGQVRLGVMSSQLGSLQLVYMTNWLGSARYRNEQKT